MKNRKAIFFLFAANTISGAAQGISMIAIPWYFASILKMPAFFGYLYAFITFLALFWGLYVGTLIDRYNRKSIFLAVSVCGAIILLSASFSGYYSGGVHYLFTAFVFCCTYFIYSVHYPNLYAFAQEITEPVHYGRITSYIEIQGQLTSMLSGALAAVLLAGTKGGAVEGLSQILQLPEIKKWELHEIFLLDGITYIIAIVLITLIRYNRIAERVIEGGTIIDRVRGGMWYLKLNPLVFLFGAATFSVFVTVLVIGFYLSPIYINAHLRGDAGVYAISDLFFAFGAVLSGVGIRWVFRKTNPVLAIILLSAITAGVYFFNIINKDHFLFYVMMFLVGLSNAGIRILRITYLFNCVPNSVIGRVGSVFGMTNVILRLFFISLFTIPFFLKEDNIVFAFMILAIFILLSSTPLILRYKNLAKQG